MIDSREPPTSRAAGWARRTGAFSVVLLVTAWLAHWYGLLETPAFLWVLGIVAFLAALALLFAVFAFSRLWAYGSRGGRDLTIGALLALVALAPYGVVVYWATIYPPLKDISTDLDDPPALPTASSRTPAMNALAPTTPGERELQTRDYPLLTGRRYDLPFDQTLDAVETVLARRNWHIEGSLPVADDMQDQVTIGALATSFGLSLPADVAIRVVADGDSTLVDMRSASRYGRHDLGDNAARITDFLADLDAQLAGQAAVSTTAE